ncbi:oxidoreductase [Alcanivorax sp. 97CO-5]|jgi:nitroreductase|uniref:nitroreductase n=1 Tax=Alcanivorax TaxID=59753 RepID=UPI0003E7E7A3|nr:MULTISPECIES: nitroreductase [unclassified Alcanivorax]EUC68155.1 oxidoreductase [Alcanivorax sp. 97CO-5]PKG00524.1 oxidoreductase [Alcanivorax sp. 97CO-6]BAP13304.1 oxidoreductase [Alcanivorax sp. NBRC 101098]
MTAYDISLADAMIQRRSVRGFTDKPVPKAVMDEVFSLAQHSPSNCNIQPWKVWVASGAVRDALRERMIEKVTNGVPFAPDYDGPPRFEGVYRERQVDCAMALYGSMGIAREDRPGRQRAELRNFELFDAPHVAFIGMERNFGVTVGLDVGMYVQSLLLSMSAYGLGACAQGSMRYYPDDVRDMLGIPSSSAIVLGISFGYEDPEVAANKARVGRVPLSDSVQFCDSV